MPSEFSLTSRTSILTMNNKLSYRRGTARRSKAVEILWTVVDVLRKTVYKK